VTPTRAALVLALMEDDSLPARELAARARIGLSTASGHLAQLVDGGLLAGELSRPPPLLPPRRTGGRCRARGTFDNRAGAAGSIPARGEGQRGDPRSAHLLRPPRAGRLGVKLTAALEHDQILVFDGDSYRLGPEAVCGSAISVLTSTSSQLLRPCLDWSERRRHVAGALGAALTGRLFELGWLKRHEANRSIEITSLGRARLRAEFGLQLGI
jgi:helix-turn-helix protein